MTVAVGDSGLCCVSVVMHATHVERLQFRLSADSAHALSASFCFRLNYPSDRIQRHVNVASAVVK